MTPTRAHGQERSPRRHRGYSLLRSGRYYLRSPIPVPTHYYFWRWWRHHPASGGSGAPPTTSDTLGNSFRANPLPCLTPAQQALLENFLLGAAAALLQVSKSQLGNPAKVFTNGGGALTVQLPIDPSKGLAVNPDVIANAGRSNRVFEHGYPFEIRANETVPVGPSTSVHVVFNTSV